MVENIIGNFERDNSACREEERNEKLMNMIIARWTTLEGKRKKALAAPKILEREVRTKEPFVLMYAINTRDFAMTSFPTPPENEVIFGSVFADKKAFE